MREIVMAHRGTIEVTSSAERGTTFTVRLPRGSAEPEHPQEPAQPEAPGA